MNSFPFWFRSKLSLFMLAIMNARFGMTNDDFPNCVNVRALFVAPFVSKNYSGCYFSQNECDGSSEKPFLNVLDAFAYVSTFSENQSKISVDCKISTFEIIIHDDCIISKVDVERIRTLKGFQTGYLSLTLNFEENLYLSLKNGKGEVSLGINILEPFSLLLPSKFAIESVVISDNITSGSAPLPFLIALSTQNIVIFYKCTFNLTGKITLVQSFNNHSSLFLSFSESFILVDEKVLSNVIIKINRSFNNPSELNTGAYLLIANSTIIFKKILNNTSPRTFLSSNFINILIRDSTIKYESIEAGFNYVFMEITKGSNILLHRCTLGFLLLMDKGNYSTVFLKSATNNSVLIRNSSLSGVIKTSTSSAICTLFSFDSNSSLYVESLKLASIDSSLAATKVFDLNVGIAAVFINSSCADLKGNQFSLLTAGNYNSLALSGVSVYSVLGNVSVVRIQQNIILIIKKSEISGFYSNIYATSTLEIFYSGVKNLLSICNCSISSLYGYRIMMSNSSNTVVISNLKIYNVTNFFQNGTLFRFSSKENTILFNCSQFELVSAMIAPANVSPCNLNRRSCVCGLLLYSEEGITSVFLRRSTLTKFEGPLGGIFIQNAIKATLQIWESSFLLNKVNFGAVSYFFRVDNIELSFDKSVFAKGQTREGGVSYLESCNKANVLLVNSQLISQEIQYRGLACSLSTGNSTQVKILNSTFFNHSFQSGGVLDMEIFFDLTIIISESTFNTLYSGQSWLFYNTRSGSSLLIFKAENLLIANIQKALTTLYSVTFVDSVLVFKNVTAKNSTNTNCLLIFIQQTITKNVSLTVFNSVFTNFSSEVTGIVGVYSGSKINVNISFCSFLNGAVKGSGGILRMGLLSKGITFIENILVINVSAISGTIYDDKYTNIDKVTIQTSLIFGSKSINEGGLVSFLSSITGLIHLSNLWIENSLAHVNVGGLIYFNSSVFSTLSIELLLVRNCSFKAIFYLSIVLDMENPSLFMYGNHFSGYFMALVSKTQFENFTIVIKDSHFWISLPFMESTLALGTIILESLNIYLSKFFEGLSIINTFQSMSGCKFSLTNISLIDDGQAQLSALDRLYLTYLMKFDGLNNTILLDDIRVNMTLFFVVDRVFALESFNNRYQILNLNFEFIILFEARYFFYVSSSREFANTSSSVIMRRISANPPVYNGLRSLLLLRGSFLVHLTESKIISKSLESFKLATIIGFNEKILKGHLVLSHSIVSLGFGLLTRNISEFYQQLILINSSNALIYAEQSSTALQIEVLSCKISLGFANFASLVYATDIEVLTIKGCDISHSYLFKSKKGYLGSIISLEYFNGQNRSEITISRVNFIGIQGFSGAIIRVRTSSSLDKCNFQNSIKLSNLIFIKSFDLSSLYYVSGKENEANVSSYDSSFEFEFNNLRYIRSYAGALFSADSLRSVPKAFSQAISKNSNKIKNVFTHTYNETYFSAPLRDIIIFTGEEGADNNTKVINDSQVEIKNIVNNEVKPNCYFHLTGVNENGALFTDNYQMEYLEFKGRRQYFIATELDLIFEITKKGLCAKQISLKTSSLPKQMLLITIKKGDLSMPNFNSDKSAQQDLNIFLTFKSCSFGQTTNSETLTCDSCPMGTYSNELGLTDLATDCEYCFDFQFYYCYGGSLRSPKPGSWRAGENSTLFLRCPNLDNCLGDFYYQRKLKTYQSHYFTGILDSIYRYESYVDSSFVLGLCRIHQAGVLCSECEGYYGISTKFTCEDCSDWTAYMKKALAILLRLVLLWGTLKKIVSTNQSLTYTKGRLSESQKNKLIVSHLLKILNDHVQTLLLIYALPFTWPSGMLSLFEFFLITGSSDFDSIFSMECVLKSAGSSLSSNYMTLYLIIFNNVISFIIIVNIETRNFNSIMKRENKPKINIITTMRRFWKTLLTYVLLINMIGQVQPFLNQFFCFPIDSQGSEYRLIRNMENECYTDEHFYIQFGLSLPVIILVSLVTPSFVVFNLLKEKLGNNLHNPENLRKYGYFFFVYKARYFYFETINFLRRLTFIFIQVFVTISVMSKNVDIINSVLILLLHQVVFTVIHRKISPYNQYYFTELDTVERTSHLILIMSCFFALVWISQSTTIKFEYALVICIFVIVSNFVFLLFWLIMYNRSSSLKLKVMQIYRKTFNLISGLVTTIVRTKSQISTRKTTNQLPSTDLATLLQIQIKELEEKLANLEEKSLKSERINFFMARDLLQAHEIMNNSFKNDNDFDEKCLIQNIQSEQMSSIEEFKQVGYHEVRVKNTNRDEILQSQGEILETELNLITKNEQTEEIQENIMAFPYLESHIRVSQMSGSLEGKSFSDYCLKFPLVIENKSEFLCDQFEVIFLENEFLDGFTTDFRAFTQLKKSETCEIFVFFRIKVKALRSKQSTPLDWDPQIRIRFRTQDFTQSLTWAEQLFFLKVNASDFVSIKWRTVEENEAEVIKNPIVDLFSYLSSRENSDVNIICRRTPVTSISRSRQIEVKDCFFSFSSYKRKELAQINYASAEIFLPFLSICSINMEVLSDSKFYYIMFLKTEQRKEVFDQFSKNLMGSLYKKTFLNLNKTF